MAKKAHDNPLEELSALLKAATQEKPVHWTDITDTFLDTQRMTRGDLVVEMNALLVPCGDIRGREHHYWYEPLPEGWAKVPLL